ncbi:hypothetical protein B0J13DRAFT_560317 [Dactylonectria estremocensis]|uniref:PD-(D/E)XK nuclease-like domain-containing protein n=1 Tax=Dactylonectria estremocensis TaxID=1079267 RepID=A0A9P9EH28_9HYPO|nr:hypothetical protein B0J13DRAFT_560317 [Dactylonectria estremocensis]
MSSPLDKFIENWLDHLLPASQHILSAVSSSRGEEGRSTKRRKISHLISPSQSSNGSGSRTGAQIPMNPSHPGTPESRSKRKLSDQATDQPVDINATPRPSKAASGNSVFRSAPSLSSQSNSQASGRSSPTRAFPVHGYNNHRIESVTMDPDNKQMPSSLADLLNDMYDFSEGRDIIPDVLKDDIVKRSASEWSLRRVRGDAYYQVKTGLSPADASRLMLTARKLVKRAGQCHHLQYDEAGWNNLVHTPLLDAVLNDKDPSQTQTVDFSPCMTASISPRFHHFPMTSTKVDYVLYLDAGDEDASTRNALAKLEETEGSVNHTAFTPLAQYPIFLSIETKRHGGDGRRADVQMAAWQAAQWSFLESQAGDGINELAFLPGIIVQGHEWKFIATTQKDLKTTLWSSHQFGTTMTLVGVFQIMAGLRRLRRWSVEVFWPWYKRHVLGSEVAPQPMAEDSPSNQISGGDWFSRT